MTPKVSVCLPNLNNVRYLPERLESICRQTLTDWELVVVDSQSDDGAWEFLQEKARREPRMRLVQTPRDGIYAGFNACIGLAQGEFVYIATSDDTMALDCLEKMVTALEANPEAGLCQCGLNVIDAEGQAHPTMRWRNFAFGRFAPEWLDRPNIRRAPLDGILHFALQTVYTSVTQLLIRRRVFDRVGLFEQRWGSKGDFEWGMRAGLLEDCVFIPEALAAWRVHPRQATGVTESAVVRRQLLDMARAAFTRVGAKSKTDLSRWPEERLLQFYRDQIVFFGVQEAGGRLRRLSFLLGEIGRRNARAAKYVFDRRHRDEFQEEAQFAALRALLGHLEIPGPVFLPLPATRA